MTQIEFDCLNRIRHAMKMHLRWDYWPDEVDGGCYDEVHGAMNYLIDTLWDYANHAWVFT